MKRCLLMICISTLAACSDPQPAERANGFSENIKTAEDSVMHEVMEAHDVAMAKMGRLNYFKIRIDSLAKTNLSAGFKPPLKDLRNKLDTAEDHMQRWMGEFNLDSAQKDGPARMPYLVSEKEKIYAARDLMLKNVAEVDSALKKL
ncbi:MAG: hypothetical protein ABI415_01320 [Flavitalea sp.]